MKGTTHVLIGLAAVSTIQQIHLSSLVCDPDKMMALAFTYVGALICDIDTGSSTVSNTLNPIKLSHIKKLLTVVYLVILTIGAVYFWGTEYLYVFIGLTALTGLSFGYISSGTFKIIRKIMVIGTSTALVLFGIFNTQPPFVMVGLLLGALSFSPHRGYSHSILSVATTYFILIYLFGHYRMNDFSVYFTIGMLSHVIADMFTEQGVMVLFPYTKKISFPVTIKTGGTVENMIMVVALLVFTLRMFEG